MYPTNLNDPKLVYGTLNGSKIGYTSTFKRRSHKGKAELRQLVLSNIVQISSMSDIFTYARHENVVFEDFRKVSFQK